MVPTTRNGIRENFIFSMVLFARRLIWKNIAVVYKCTWYSKFNIQKEYVSSNQVFLVKRQYRYSKMNAFSQLIVEVQRVSDITFLNYFYVLYRWAEAELNKENRNFFISRHGNSQKPFSGTILIFFECFSVLPQQIDSQTTIVGIQ